MGLPLWFGLILTATVTGAAMWKGGSDERLAAGGFVLGWAITLAFRDKSWFGTQWGAFGVDAAYLMLIVFVALRSKRFWPLFAAGFHLLGVITHAAHMVDSKLNAWTYATASVIWTHLLLVAIGCGVIGTWKTAQNVDMSFPDDARR